MSVDFKNLLNSILGVADTVSNATGGKVSYEGLQGVLNRYNGGGGQSGTPAVVKGAPANVQAQRDDAETAFVDDVGDEAPDGDSSNGTSDKDKDKNSSQIMTAANVPDSQVPPQEAAQMQQFDNAASGLSEYFDNINAWNSLQSKSSKKLNEASVNEERKKFAGSDPEAIRNNLNNTAILQGITGNAGAGAIGSVMPYGQVEMPSYSTEDIKAAQSEAKQKSEDYESGKKEEPSPNLDFQPFTTMSQRDEFYSFLGTPEGQAWLELHGGSGYEDEENGYEKLRLSHDMDAWGDLLGYDPDVAGIGSWRGRYGSAGVDLDDLASLEYYLYGPDAINQEAFDRALAGQGDFDLSKLGGGNDFENMAKYLLNNSSYGPELIAALEGSGLDANDFAALALGAAVSQGNYNPTADDINRILGAAGEGMEIGIGGDYTEQYGAPDRDYQLSDIMNARGLNSNEKGSYGNVTIDDQLLPYLMAYANSNQPEDKRYGAKKRG